MAAAAMGRAQHPGRQELGSEQVTFSPKEGSLRLWSGVCPCSEYVLKMGGNCSLLLWNLEKH